MPPSAEELSFNSQGACPACGGTGVVRRVDEATLVPDDSLTIDQGAVAPWNSLMWSLMTDVCRAMGVRTDVPFKELSEREKEIVLHGPAEKKHILYRAKNSDVATELDFTFYNAVYTVENALAKVKDESGMKRVEKFLKAGGLPRVRGKPAERGRPGPTASGDPPGRGLPDDPSGPLGLGGRGAGQPAGGDEAHGGEHLRVLPHRGRAADGAGPGISDPGPGLFHFVYGGAAADAAGPGGAQPHDGGCCTCWTSPPSACIPPTSWAWSG